MTPQEIDRFFKILSKELTQPVQILLTGAAAGAIWGHIRPSMDIDFSVEPTRKSKQNWTFIQQALARSTQKSGISVQYAQDIDRWGMISLMDYKKHTLPYKKFGSIDVRLLEPAYWSIGKMTRYLDTDVQDMIGAFSRREVSLERLLRVWGIALKESVRSTEQLEFRRHVEHFLAVHGKRLWGKGFDVEKSVLKFHRHAGIS